MDVDGRSKRDRCTRPRKRRGKMTPQLPSQKREGRPTIEFRSSGRKRRRSLRGKPQRKKKRRGGWKRQSVVVERSRRSRKGRGSRQSQMNEDGTSKGVCARARKRRGKMTMPQLPSQMGGGGPMKEFRSSARKRMRSGRGRPQRKKKRGGDWKCWSTFVESKRRIRKRRFRSKQKRRIVSSPRIASTRSKRISSRGPYAPLIR